MAKKQGKSEAKITVRHRPDAEWLTYDICKHYMKLAEKITDRSICDSDLVRGTLLYRGWLRPFPFHLADHGSIC